MKNRTEQKFDIVKPVFVDTIPADPEDLKAGILYISMKYNTLVQRCPCGCGGLSEIGLHPATRRLIYDGESVSIEPSIGVRTLRCRSHYWIRRNRIVWEKPLGKEFDEFLDRNREDLTLSYLERSDARRSTFERRGWSRLVQRIMTLLRK